MDNRSFMPSVQRTIDMLERLLAHSQRLILQEMMAAVNSLRSTLFADEPWPPLRRILARGLCWPALQRDDPRLNRLLEHLSRRYLGRNTPLTLQIERSFLVTLQSLRSWQGTVIDVERAWKR